MSAATAKDRGAVNAQPIPWLGERVLKPYEGTIAELRPTIVLVRPAKGRREFKLGTVPCFYGEIERA